MCTLLILSARYCKLAIPVDPTGEVHSGCNCQKARDRTDEQCVVLKSQEQIDQHIEKAEDGKGPRSLQPAGENPSFVGREQRHGATAGEQEGKVEADLFSKRQEEQEKDDLGCSDEDVLCRVDTLGGRRLEYKVGEKG